MAEPSTAQTPAAAVPWPVLVALGVLLAGSCLAVWGAGAQNRITSDRYDVRQPALSQDVPVEAHALWILNILDQGRVSLSEVEETLSPRFLSQVSAQDFARSIPLLTQGSTFDLRGFTTSTMLGLDELRLALSNQDGQVLDLTITSDVSDPEHIQGLLFLEGESDRGPFSSVEVVAHIAAAWGLVIAGGYCWLVRGRTKAGVLLLASGLVWLMQFLELTDAAVPYTMGLVAGPVAALLAVLGLLALAANSDRVGLIAAMLAALAAAASISPLLAIDTSVAQLPDQLLSITHNRQTAVLFAVLERTLAIMAALALAAALWSRYVRNAGVGRSFRQMLVVVGMFVAAIVVFVAGWGLTGEHHDLSQSPLVSLAALSIPLGVGFEAGRENRSVMGGVVSMVGTADAPLSRSDLQASLAIALGDPSVELAFWAPDEQHYVTTNGLPISVEASAERAVTMLDSGGEPIGAVLHSPALASDPERVRAATAAARLAIDNTRLQALVVAELRSSRSRIVESAEQARRAVERDLHDGAQQRLIALQLSLKLEQQRAERAGVPVEAGFLQSLSEELGGAIDELRELGRGLRPSALDHGLRAAVDSLAERSPLPIVTDISLERAPSAIESAAYFVINEAVANATRHSGADHIRVTTTVDDDAALHVEVADDGSGGAHKGAGSGLQSLEDRVLALDGHWQIDSPAGGGTIVRAVLPTNQERFPK